ncbi:hypothetical protein [Proteus phage PM2]|uniref:Trimeric autotransporter adhesin YadA-like C-terminal membrane anchor domain-containing protein n=1 Tax=Proteus phage PM2 TaxID=2025809 RepID=A0A249XWN1_9CAUD|nr:hypothetical protein KNT71_gp088 [Proteus phage PM2]ASZ76374.1 hypothetical protein [Proteus phage PM2]
MKITLVVATLTALLSINAMASSDNNWISPTPDHTFHEGTVNESWNMYNKDIDNKMDKMKAGFASSAAMNNIPLDFSKTITIGLGVGGYKSGSAVAVGFGASPENSNVSFKMSGAFDSESNTTVGTGLAFSW